MEFKSIKRVATFAGVLLVLLLIGTAVFSVLSIPDIVENSIISFIRK